MTQMHEQHDQAGIPPTWDAGQIPDHEDPIGMNYSDPGSLISSPLHGLCTSLIRERLDETNRKVELLAERLVQLRRRIENLILDPACNELDTAKGHDDSARIHDPNHEMTVAGARQWMARSSTRRAISIITRSSGRKPRSPNPWRSHP
jgi:hypothetical protein